MTVQDSLLLLGRLLGVLHQGFQVLPTVMGRPGRERDLSGVGLVTKHIHQDCTQSADHASGLACCPDLRLGFGPVEVPACDVIKGSLNRAALLMRSG